MNQLIGQYAPATAATDREKRAERNKQQVERIGEQLRTQLHRRSDQLLDESNEFCDVQWLCKYVGNHQ